MKHLKMILVSLFLGVAILGQTTLVSAQLAVFDPANYGQQVQQLKAYLDMYRNAIQQLRQAEDTYKKITGVRDVASLYRAVANIASYQTLPKDVKDVVMQTAQILTDFSVLEGEIRAAREQTTRVSKDIFKNKNSAEATRWGQDVDRISMAFATGATIYGETAKRNDTINGLITAIAKTEDPKAIADLQARIAGEGLLIENEQNRTAALKIAQEARKEQLERQGKDDLLKIGKKGITDTNFTWPK